MFKNRVYVSVFLYHLVFIAVSYSFARTNGGDSLLYWGKILDFSDNSWFDFANYGAKAIVFLNYPFFTLGLPLWFGFLLYGIIGFFGILKWMQWAELVVKDALVYKGFNLLYLVFFLPNLHFWTATLGKEPIVFWGIAAVIYGFTVQKFRTFGFVAGSLAVLLVRPHVALMLLAAFGITEIFDRRLVFKKRMLGAAGALLGTTLLLYAVLQITNINYWDWERIRYFNEYSVLSFRASGSYVPMLEYSHFFKWCSVLFRPLFVDAHSVFAFLASIENAFFLLIFIVAACCMIRFYKKMKYPPEVVLVFLFTAIAVLLYAERYANLGIFMRTKIMFQPFLLVCLLLLVHRGFNLKKLPNE